LVASESDLEQRVLLSAGAVDASQSRDSDTADVDSSTQPSATVSNNEFPDTEGGRLTTSSSDQFEFTYDRVQVAVSDSDQNYNLLLTGGIVSDLAQRSPARPGAVRTPETDNPNSSQSPDRTPAIGGQLPSIDDAASLDKSLVAAGSSMITRRTSVASDPEREPVTNRKAGYQDQPVQLQGPLTPRIAVSMESTFTVLISDRWAPGQEQQSQPDGLSTRDSADPTGRWRASQPDPHQPGDAQRGPSRLELLDYAYSVQTQTLRRPTDHVTTEHVGSSAVGKVLKALAQFDASAFVDLENDELTGWMHDQLGLNRIVDSFDRSESADNVNAYAATSEVSETQRDGERLQQAFLRIEVAAFPDTYVTLISQQPPEPPSVAGIWQRIRFDCSPRGPPVSQSLSGSEFTRQNSNAPQLQQLRFSIAPRGPSVISVN